MLGFLLLRLRGCGGATAAASAGMGTVDGRGGTSTAGGGGCSSGADALRVLFGGRRTISDFFAFSGWEVACLLAELAAGSGRGWEWGRFSGRGGTEDFLDSLGRCEDEDVGVTAGVCGLDEKDESVSESE